MKKHIFGAILFSLIVGISGVIALIFAEIPQPDKVAVLNVPTFESRSRCHKKKHWNKETGAASVNVVQAVFNERTKLLDTNLSIKQEDFSTRNVSVALHFFAEDAKGVRYLSSENYFFKPVFNRFGTAAQATPPRWYPWMDDLTGRENLYVIADSNFKAGDRNLQPEFIESKAVPIISLKGK